MAYLASNGSCFLPWADIMVPLFDVSWWAWVGIVLVLTQVIIALVTVYFHRAVSHRSVVLAPSAHRVCRFLSWFLIAMVPQEFAAVHRKHHAKCDTGEDPHSPANHGWAGVLFGGLGLYRKEVANPETIEKYGQGMAPEPFEGFYRRFPNLGILTFGALLTLTLGWKGLLAWGLCLIWIPFWAAGVVNGLGHHMGYRRFSTDDLSTNLWPWGLWIGGEELHNNHHADPASPRFSRSWYELDVGWWWIKGLQAVGLATPREVSTPASAPPFTRLLAKRYDWLERFQTSMSHDLSGVLAQHGYRHWRHFSRSADRQDSLSKKARDRFNAAIADPVLAEAHRLEASLRDLWQTRKSNAQQSLAAMDEWLERARQSARPALSRFCEDLSPARG